MSKKNPIIPKPPLKSFIAVAIGGVVTIEIPRITSKRSKIVVKKGRRESNCNAAAAAAAA